MNEHVISFWSDDLSTGVDEIDNDHKSLFQIFQNAYRASQTQTNTSDLYRMMANLLNYTEVHFAREEALMEATPYPYLDKHRDIHFELIKNLKEQIVLVQNNKQNPQQFVIFLKDWFIEHINGTDKRVEPYTRMNLESIQLATENIEPLTTLRYSRIFLVDDDSAFSELLQAMTEEAGFRATIYNSSTEFLHTTISNQDIIVLDLNMPDKDGIEVMRELANQGITPTFILVSGFDDRVLQSARQFAESRKLHVAGTLSKPVYFESFTQVIKEAINEKAISYIQSSLTDFTPTSDQADPEKNSNNIDRKNAITLAELKRGLEQQEFIVHLQPQIKFSDGSLCGVEALVRWQHPVRGLVFPDQIIPLVEKNKLMAELTQTVILESIKSLTKLKAANIEVSISVNISAQNIVDLKFPESLDILLKAHNLEPEQFTLELTESEIITDTSIALDIFNRLRMKGFSLSIDDFGTGDSSLKKLYQSPFSELKIDQHFVSRMADDQEANSIVRICTILANEFNMTTVAEGIETREVWNKLTEMGCDIAQGYLISKPLPVDQLIIWAKKHNQSSDYQSCP